jgi:phage baseplate assembly protein V
MIRLLESIRRSIRLIVGKCILTACKVSEDGIESNVILLGNEKHSAVKVMQHYGFASLPDDDAEAVALFVGGSRDNGVVTAEQGNPEDIPKLEKGEVSLFSRFGQKIVLKKDGSILIVPKEGEIVRVESDVEFTGDLKVLCDGIFITMQNHQHQTAVGPTSPPTPGR